MLKSLLHGALGDFVKCHAANALGLFFPLLLGFGAVAQLVSQVSSDGFAFAVRVRRQINHVRRTCQLLQPGDNFFFPRDNDVFGVEIILDVDTKSALGQIFHVAERCLDRVSRAQIFLDRLRLGWRLDYY